MSRPVALAALLALAACARIRAPEVPALRVGVPADYPPFAETRDGTVAGFDVDVLRRFATDTGRRVTFVRFRWPDLIADLGADRFDLAAGGITMRPERALAGRFTRPVLETGAVVLAPAALADVDRPSVRLGVNAGGHLERVARRLFPHAALHPTPDNRDLAALLVHGEVDAVLTDDVEAPRLERAVPGTHRIGPLTRDRKAYLGREPALVEALDAWLRAREGDGALDALRERWFGAEHRLGRSRFASDLAALVALVDLRLALMPAVAAAKEAVGRPVEDPAQEARVVAGGRAQATALGLDPDAAETLVRAQIDAGRAVQHTWLVTPRARRPPVDSVDLDREARPALAAISAAVIARAADVARSPGSPPIDPARIAADLDPAVPRPACEAIGRAVAGLRPMRARSANRGL